MMANSCAYCKGAGPFTREHVLPAWLARKLDGYPHVSPGLGRHMLGGALVVGDVCASCNNGVLSQLDHTARDYWTRGLQRGRGLEARLIEPMARWAAKVAYNGQRCVLAAGTAGLEPPMPEELGAWILKGGRAPESVGLSICRMQGDHRDAAAVGLFGSSGTMLPRRYLKLAETSIFIAWDPPKQEGIAKVIAGEDRGRLPAVALESDGAGITVPVMRDPDMPLRAFWGNRDLLAAMAARYPA